MTKRAERIAELEARLAALRREQQAADKRARALASKAARALATRRKILLGAYLLHQADDDLQQAYFLRIGEVSFHEWLRPADRALFLPPASELPGGNAGSPPSVDPAAAANAAEVSR